MAWDAGFASVHVGVDGSSEKLLDTKTVAYHEAGHAVVACRLGIAIARVTTRVAGGALFGGEC